jgi:3-oxoadipate enol-lactonase
VRGEIMTVELNYRVDGTGPRIVLLHPVGLDLSFFDPLVAELSPHFQVLRVDLRGHGGTPPGRHDSQPRLGDFAGDVDAAMKRLQYGPAVVVGFSLGGMVAQVMALDHHDVVSALITSVCGSTFGKDARKMLRERGDSAGRNGMASIVDSTMERWFSKEFRERGGDALARQRILSNDVQSWKQTWHAIAELDTAPRLHEITVPTLCLAAEKDVSVPPEMVEEVAKAIPGAHFAVIPNTPHMLFIEDPSSVAAAIIGFPGSSFR